MPSSATVPALLAAAVVACSAPGPSRDYEAAARTWNELVRIDPERAAEDPRSDEVLERLGRVPSGSSDAPAATALRVRIETERRERAAERARRDELLRRAAVPALPVSGPAATTGAGSGAGAVQPGAGQPGAGPPIAPGLKADAFRAAYGSCFAPAGEVALTPAGAAARPGQLWALKEDGPCREAHAALTGQVVVLADGEVVAVRPASAVRRIELRQDAELATLPDGRPGMVVDGKLVPIPPGARVVRPEPAGKAP